MEDIKKNPSFLTSKEDLLFLLKENNFFLSKQRGQNFLIDPQIKEKLLSFIPDSHAILEIGSGLGHFTSYLQKKTSFLLGIELDQGFYHLLKDTFKTPNISFKHQDILKTNLQDLQQISFQPWICVSNIPYYITTKIIEKLVKHMPIFSEIFLLLQKDFFYDKLHFQENDTHLSEVFAKIAPYYHVKALCTVKKDCFFPKPKIESLFINLSRKKDFNDASYADYSEFIEDIFKEPKKKLNAKIKNHCDKKKKTFKELSNNSLLNERIHHLTLENIQNLWESIS